VSDPAHWRGQVLFICTGNQCRSPMAEAFLRAKQPPESGICVTSAGLLGDGTPPPKQAVRVMARAGIDIAGRPSRRVDAAALAEADLIIGMTRRHLPEVATMDHVALPRSFTFLDLIKRARLVGSPAPTESLSQWAQRLSTGRTQASILSAAESDDVADPAGRGRREYRRTARELDRLTTELATLLFGVGPPANADLTRDR
jgi:low molecular weight protein-tyrosine phosphatase